LLFNFASEYAISRVQVNQDGFKLNGTHQLLVYAYDVNVPRGRVHTTEQNTDALVVASKETGIEVNADKSKYVVISRDRNAGRSHSMKISSAFETVEEFRYLGTTFTNQTYIQEEIKSNLKSRNACYHSVQNILSSSLVPKNVKIKKYRTIMSPVVLYGYETWSLILTSGRRLRVFANRMLGRVFGPKRDEVTGEWRKLHNVRSLVICSHQILFG